MIAVDCSLTLKISGIESDDLLREEVGRIREGLLLLEESGCGIRDAAVSLDPAELSLAIDLVSEDATFEDARRTADSSIRTALQALALALPGHGVDPSHSAVGRVDS